MFNTTDESVKRNLGYTYCVITTENLTGWIGGGRWLHYVPCVGEKLYTEYGTYTVTERYSVCDHKDGGNHCVLKVKPC